MLERLTKTIQIEAGWSQIQAPDSGSCDPVRALLSSSVFQAIVKHVRRLRQGSQEARRRVPQTMGKLIREDDVLKATLDLRDVRFKREAECKDEKKRGRHEGGCHDGRERPKQLEMWAQRTS